MCVGATEQSIPTAEMQDSRLQVKDRNKHVEKYFKRPISTNVRKYINEVKNTKCVLCSVDHATRFSSCK
jgi:hypothetical protein